MSSIFKINSRFSALVEDVKNDNNPSTSNKGGYEKSSNNSFSFKRNDRHMGDDKLVNSFNETKRKHELDRKNKEIAEALSDKNFPVLGVINRPTLDVNESKVASFVDKLNVQNIKNCVDSCEDYIQPGYVVITKDKYGEKLRFSCEEENNPNKVLDSLVNLYELRNEKYIELWGEDVYEKVFKFPNYDYDYFDRLDHQYEEELERELEKRRELESYSYVSSDEY